METIKGSNTKSVLPPKRRRGAALAAVSIAAAGLAAIPSVQAAGAESGKPVVSTMTIGQEGKVLVSSGEALYTLTPGATACEAQCLKIWPALALSATAKHAKAGHGVPQSALGVTHGPGGIRQVTYHGHALYWYSGDSHGHVNGNFTDPWGKWTAVVVGQHAVPTGTGSTSGGSTAGSGGVSF